MSNNPAWSYTQHESHERERMSDEHLPSCYSRPESIDAWHHERMLKTVLPLVRAYPSATWMTVGDGAFGSDAHFLEKHGVDVTATSLTDDRLKVACDRGYIKKFSAQNAERIAHQDGAFDFVLCKESYHHFPRPAIAFYEMLRVARKALILIEPIEDGMKPLQYVKSFIKKLIRGDATTEFEESGNFIYKISQREIEKMLTALNFETFAINRINDFYHPRISHSPYRPFSLNTSLTHLGLFAQNAMCKTGLLGYGLATAVIFKQRPTSELVQDAQQTGYRFIDLPKNIYLSNSVSNAT